MEGISQIDPDMDDEEALKFIELPEETLYLIDKVVRLRSKAGPIGVDNSELINMELEEEFKARNQYIENLVNGGKARLAYQESQQQEDKENQNNQKLLERLTSAASKTNYNKSKMSAMPTHSKSHIGDRSAAAVSHEEWIRKKKHEELLREQLIIEAKKDMLE